MNRSPDLRVYRAAAQTIRNAQTDVLNEIGLRLAQSSIPFEHRMAFAELLDDVRSSVAQGDTDTITKAQPIELAESEFWKGMTAREIATFQLRVRKLCMPFDVFHQALEDALGRPVFTHEMGLNWSGLVSELAGGRPAPSLAEVLDLIPADKRIIVFTPPGDPGSV